MNLMNDKEREFLATVFNAALDDALFLEAMMPEWAIRRSTGDYRDPGAILATRDGRHIGNAVVLDWIKEVHYKVCGVVTSHAKVMTDIGTIIYLNEEEMEIRFFPPQYIADPVEAEAARTRTRAD